MALLPCVTAGSPIIVSRRLTPRLLTATPESVDILWSKIVKAVAVDDGALVKTGAVHSAKVSTTPGDSGCVPSLPTHFRCADEEGNSSYVICVYCDDSWDKEAVGKVFKTLVEDLNCVSSAYKVRPEPGSCFVSCKILRELLIANRRSLGSDRPTRSRFLGSTASTRAASVRVCTAR